MAIEIISIGSSSSGNSYIIKTGSANIILDVGLAAKHILAGLSEADLGPEDIDAVLVTHEHTDHVKSIRAISRKCCRAMVYASRGTIATAPNFSYVPGERLHAVRAGEKFSVNGGDTEVLVFPLSHDAREPVGYAVSCGGEKLAVVTDTGTITDAIYAAVHDADILVLESNHDEHLLMFGEYPYSLKCRIKSDFGHLSNESAGEMLTRILRERDGGRVPRVMLAHLSDHNNLPLIARETVVQLLKEEGFVRDRDYTLLIAAKEVITHL